MSGGSLDYGYSKVDMLADDIEAMFINDGKYKEEWDRVVTEGDRLADATDKERVSILAEVKSLLSDMRQVAKRAKELEWYVSGDTGATSYLKRLKEIK